MKVPDFTKLASIKSREHIRERITPKLGDSLYLHLSDLLHAMTLFATEEAIDILDFGAGASPYRSLFPNARYRRADFEIDGEDKLDYTLDESLVIAESANSFDLIISTQVLEHVLEPIVYLRECRRLLRPKGKLILTTHGVFADHPCPLDLHRWTADGLLKLAKNSGFSDAYVKKLTIGPRALLFLYDMHGRSMHRREASIFSAIFAIYYRFHLVFRPAIHRWADMFFPNSRISQCHAAAGDIYINLILCAAK